MTVQLRSVSTAAGDDESSVAVTLPSQTADGDLMIAITGGFDNDATFAAPAGWVFLGEDADGTGVRSKLFKKFASSEPASETWNFSDGTVTGAITVSVASFFGAHDLLMWNKRVTGTSNPSFGRQLDAARNSVGYSALVWRQDTTDTPTCSGTVGEEKYEFTASDPVSGIRRSQCGYYYGQPDVNDIVNAGDSLSENGITTSPDPLFGIHWSMLIGDRQRDDEQWSDTNGDFAVELHLDDPQVDSTGSIETTFQGDITGQVDAVTASSGSGAELVRDGRNSTWWFSGTATGWVQHDFGSGVTKLIKRYRIGSNTGGSGVDPMVWTLQGSTDGVAFDVIDTRTNESFSKRGETREYRVISPAEYRFYRLDITANNSSAGTTNIRVGEFRLSALDVWEPITEFVQESDKIRITRGTQGTTDRNDFSRAYMTLKNVDGRFSLRNADGPYFGALKRNTETRISKAFGTKALQLQGSVAPQGHVKTIPFTGESVFVYHVGDCVRTTLTDAMQVAGDIDVRVDVHPESWRGEQMLAGIATSSTRDPDWIFYIDDEGLLSFSWNSTLAEPDPVVQSTIAVPDLNRQTVRVTLDADDGAGGHVVTFYTSDSPTGLWTRLGDPVVRSGTTQILYTGGALCIGQVGSLGQRGVHGRVYGFQLRDGIDGTLLSDIDFTVVANGARSFTDSDGNRWIMVRDAVVSNRRFRFHGEVAEWPIAWDPTGNWVEVGVTAAGIQRRLERGSGQDSVMYRFHTKGLVEEPSAFRVHANPAAYWPCEDEADTFLIASAISDQPGMQVSEGTPDFAAFNDFKESSGIITLKNAKLGGRVANNPSGHADIRWIMAAPDTIAVGSNIITLYGSGGVGRWTLDYTATDTWRLRGFTGEDASTIGIDTGNFSVSTLGELLHCRLLLETDGGTVTATVDARGVNGVQAGTDSASATTTMGRIFRLNVNDGDTKMDDVSVGHIALYGTTRVPRFTSPLNAFIYEEAAARIEGVCLEEEIEFRHTGSIANSAFVGYQTVSTTFEVMSASAFSDQGFFVDPLDKLGFEYRTHRALYNQAAHLTLDYDAGELSGELRPTADDAYLVNDYTARRGSAGSARSVRQTGALSVDEVGEYSKEQSYNLAHEGQCIDLASWEVHRGTLDEERYNRIEIALENLRIAADNTLIESILTLDVGKRVDVTDPPSFLVQEDIRQVVVGYEEWFDNFQHDFRLNTVAERVYEIARYDDGYHFDTEDSGPFEDVSASATSFEIITNTGPRWTIGDVSFTGATATGVATSDTPDYLVCTDADAADITIGDEFRLFDSAGELKERTVFTVTGLPSGFGFTNVEFSPDALARTVTDDQVRVGTFTGNAEAFPFDAFMNGERMTVTGAAVGSTSFSSDSFDRADSSTDLGSTDGGVVQAWTQDSGTWGIDNNQAWISVSGASIATINGNANLEIVELEVPVWTAGEVQVIFRHVDNSNYCRFGGTVGSTASLQIISGGATAYSQDADATEFALAAGDKLGVRCNGSVIECFVNDKLAMTVSNTTNESETRVGMRINSSTATRIDNFYVEITSSSQVLTVERGVNGVAVPHKAGSSISLYNRPYRGM